jgi:hypothetical protein
MSKTSGTLRRKKQKHGILEDPWKSLYMCWLEKRSICLQPAELMTVRQGQEIVNKVNLVGTEESFVLDEWQLSSDAKDRKETKFTLVNKSDGTKLSLKADTKDDTERWIAAIQEILDSDPPEESDASDTRSEESQSDSDLTFQLDGYHNFFYHNGDKYEGEWKQGKKHGTGRYIRSDGTIYQVPILVAFRSVFRPSESKCLLKCNDSAGRISG